MRAAVVAARARAGSSLRPLTIVPAPRIRPPVIDDSTDDWPTERCAESPYVQDALAVDFSLRSDHDLFGEQPTRRDDLPDPRDWAAHIAQALVEVMAGVRPAPQLLRWTTPEVYAVVARRAAVSARRGMPPARRTVVRSLRICEPADGVAEASAVVVDGGRVRALAMRLVGLDGRWRVEALQVG
ncbi:Rv3235 family protein [Pedococcus sp. KACC 23699]|uniref:Rv3235 family protein n=1 Tax=Pedococcus sp. KACC 23699 TaxID=3149228 RepID=A0AAU7JWN1_9MICO